MNTRVLTVTLNPAVDHTIEVPGFSLDAVNRASFSRRDPGGKGINVATALSEGGMKTVVTGFLGKENAGLFTRHFQTAGLTDRFIYVEGSTREGLKVVDPVVKVTTDINFKGFQLHTDDITAFLTQYTELAGDFGFVILSGSLPAGVRSDIYGELASIAASRGAFVAVDTSGRALESAIESGSAHLIKPNIDELAEIYPGIKEAGDPLEAIDEMVGTLLSKVGMVALTLGGEGSRLYTAKERLEASTPPISVKSTVGAGDTFLAGFIHGYSVDAEAAHALKTAASWAASKLTMYGPGLSEENPPSRFLDSIQIRHF